MTSSSIAWGVAAIEFGGVVGVEVGVGEEVGLGEVGGGELVIRVAQYWRVEERLSRMCWASGYTSSDQVSNRGYTIRSMNVTCTHTHRHTHQYGVQKD